MKLKRLLTVALAISAGFAAFGQESQYIKNNWFAGAGGGLNLGYDGQKYVDRVDSHRGAGYAVDVYAGKWFNDLAGFRLGYTGVKTSNTFDDFDKKPLTYLHGDVLFRIHKNIVPYIHAGYMKIDNGTAAGGIGVAFPIALGKVVSIVPDVKYAAMSSKAFDTGKRAPGSLLSANVGLAFNLGGKPVPRVEYVDKEIVKYVDREKVVRDTVYIRQEPDVKGKAAEINTFLQNITLFEWDSFEITKDAKVGLDKVIAWMKEYPSVTAKVEGHTDNTGTEKYNQELSVKRAKAIVDYLEANGIAANRLSYEGFGETRPVASNDTSTGRQMNRRIEMIFSNN